MDAATEFASNSSRSDPLAGSNAPAVAGGSKVLLSFRNVTKRYGDTTAVADVTFDVAEGEFITLLGPSGCGKTTTLMLIAGFEQPDGGTIHLGGARMNGVPPHRRRVGLVFQNYALFPHLSVFDNIAFALQNLRWSKGRIAERVNDLLALVRLEDLGHRRPAQLSGGQQQRVAIARALSFAPSLLLLDEPLGALDRRLREHMHLELRRIHRTLGVTMVYVTHDQEEALAMSDRIALMEAGRIIAFDTPDRLYKVPPSRPAATMVGDNNVIQGRTLDIDLVEVGPWRFPARHTLGLGAPAIVVIRPELIRLMKAPADDYVLAGHVEEKLYLGDITKYRVRTPDGLVLVAKLFNAGGHEDFDIGTPVACGWSASDALVFAEQGVSAG